MADPSNVLSMMARAQRSPVLRWLLGLGGFGLMPASPDDDPIRRLQVRVLTTIEGIGAVVLMLLALLVAGAAALLADGPIVPGWILMVGGTVAMVLALRSIWRSRRARIAVPGISWLACLLNLLAMAVAVLALAAERSAG